MAYRVPFVDPRTHYRRYKAEIDGALSDCLENGDLIHRRQLFGFEKNLAAYVGSGDAVGLASGYHALHFALWAKKLREGDEVITVAHTFAATISAIVHVNATPVLVEVGPDHNMDMNALEKAVTPRTRGIIPVHLNGRMCDMERCMAIAKKHSLFVVEDSCQGLGASFKGKRGGAWETGCFSFYPFKALGGLGDGGALTTSDPEIAQTARWLRYNGEDRLTGEFHMHGYTALLDNIQAAVLDAKLKHFDEWVAHRRAMAELYRRGLEGLKGINTPHYPGKEYFDTYQNYVIRSDKRDALRAFLTEEGVETLVSWPRPVWSYPGLNLPNPHLAFTELLCREVISLPMSAETTPEHVDITVKAIRKFTEK